MPTPSDQKYFGAWNTCASFMVPAPYSAMTVVPMENAMGFAVAADVTASRQSSR